MDVRARRAWLPFVLALGLAACAVTQHQAQAPAPHTPRASGGVNRAEHRDKPYVVLVSLDGFRADYLDAKPIPNIRRVMKRGTRARALLPVFPTLTFPNHYSLVTGLYPEHHGIVANSFYDPARKQSYALGNRDTVTDGTWYRGEPIWVTAETQGMVSACFFWPGSEAAIKGVRPTMSRDYDGKVPMAERVNTVIGWLKMPAETRPHLITLYFSNIDTATHGGPLNSPAVDDAVAAVDGGIGMLLDGIDALPLRDRVYVLLTSDHGMVETTNKQGIRLDSLMSADDVAQAYGGPVANVHLKNRDSAGRVRDEINSRLKQGRAYLRSDVPDRHHYRADPRIGDIVIIMDESWTILAAPRVVEAVKELVTRDRRGAHGWDPAYPSMHAIFVASGPGIRAGATIPAVNNIDVYPLMTELLGLEPADDLDGRKGLKNLLTR